MNATLQQTPTGKTEVRIAVEWSEVAADYDELLAGYGKVALPGFRSGKAPRAIIEQRLRQQIRDDFTARCGRRLAREALRDRHLRAAGPIAVVAIQLEPRREFSFTAEFVPVPKLELPDYPAMPLTRTTEDERRDEISEWLLAHTPGDVPEPLIRQECEREFQPGSAEPEAAARRVKLRLILEQIAEAEGIEVDQSDVDARIEKTAAENGVPPAELRQKLAREDTLNRLRSLLRAEQTLAYLLSRAGTESGIDETGNLTTERKRTT